MKGLAESSPFHLLTNPHVINRFIFGHGVVIYYIFSHGDVSIRFNGKNDNVVLEYAIITIKHVLSDALTSAGPLGRVETLAFQARGFNASLGTQQKAMFDPYIIDATWHRKHTNR